MSNEIGKLIRQMRKSAGMTQMKLAEKLNITYQQVQKYEYGESTLSLNRLFQIAGVFDVPVDVFFPEDEARRASSSKETLSDEEVKLILLYRRLKGKKLKTDFLSMLENLADIRGLSE
ncbi:MAG: helix-turn-helix transcriptional regulator [Nitrospirota bacterium]